MVSTKRTLDVCFLIILFLYVVLITRQFLLTERYLELVSKSSTENVSTTITKIIRTQPSKKASCGREPLSLLGRRDVNLDDPLLASPVPSKALQLRPGGSWSPEDCLPTRKVAILVPYRGRPKQLTTFVNHIHPILQRQRLDYTVFVIEQAGEAKFNKGAIYNIGFNKTLQYADYDCYVFHDVDLLCENDRNYYGCPESPMHMCPAIDKFKYKLPYLNLVGGIQAFEKNDYIKVNGYSNIFWGWGAEDDNLYQRIIKKGFQLRRPSMDVGRYKMNWREHYRRDGWNSENQKLYLSKKSNQDTDGLNSIYKLKFKITEHLEPLFTRILIDLQRQ